MLLFLLLWADMLEQELVHTWFGLPREMLLLVLPWMEGVLLLLPAWAGVLLLLLPLLLRRVDRLLLPLWACLLDPPNELPQIHDSLTLAEGLLLLGRHEPVLPSHLLACLGTLP